MQKVKIAYIKEIKDDKGKFGPQKKITFAEELDGGDRTISGWVPIKQFKEEDWVAGKTLELIISQNGKYTNFKMPTQNSKQDEKIDRILKGVEFIYKEIQELKKKIDVRDLDAGFVKPKDMDLGEDRSLRDF